MKKTLTIILLLMALLLTGCSDKSEDIARDLPKTLSIKTDVPSDYPEKVTSYTVEWFAVDEDAAVKALMQNDSPRRLEYAEGPQYSDSFGDTEEFLNIYSKGGFDYHLYTDDNQKYWLSMLNGDMRAAKPWDDYTSSLYKDMEEYPRDVELDFLDRESAISQAKNALAKCGITDIEAEYAESRTVDIMNHNREQYNSMIEKGWSDHISELIWSDPFTKAQENYYIEFRKILDGIPFTKNNWLRNVGSKITNTEINVVISADGLLQVKVGRLFDVLEPISTDEIISPEEALQVYLDEYSKSIHFTNTEILGMELNYVVVLDSKGMYAKPAWIITAATERKAEEYENAEEDFIEYDTTAVSAYSGVILERETDTR